MSPPSQRSRFLPPAPISGNGKQQQRHGKPPQPPIELRQKHLHTTKIRNSGDQPQQGKDKIKIEKTKTKSAVVITRKANLTSSATKSKYAKVIEAEGKTDNYCIQIPNDVPLTKGCRSLRDSSIVGHGVRDGNTIENTKILSRCQLLPPLQQTAGGGEDVRKKTTCLDRARGLASRRNAPSALSNDGNYQHGDSVYEFPASPPRPGMTGNGRKTKMTATEASVVRTLLRGHEEFMELLHRRTKLREKITIRGISYQPVHEDESFAPENHEDAMSHLYDSPGDDRLCYDALWSKPEECERLDTLRTIDSIPSWTCTSHTTDRSQPSVSTGSVYEILDGIDDGAAAGLCGGGGGDGVDTVDMDAIINSHVHGDMYGPPCTPAYAPTFLSLISEMGEGEE